MKAKTYYRIYSHIQAVKGDKVSILYDFQKNQVIYINHSLHALIELFDNYSIKELELKFKDQISLFNENIDYLIKKRVLFKTNSPQDFLNVDFSYETPEHITNSVLEYSGNYSLDKVFNELEKLLVKYVELRLHKLSTMEYEKVFQSLSKYLSQGVRSLQLMVPYDDKKIIMKILDRNRYPKIIRILFYNAKSSTVLLKESVELCFTSENLREIRNKNNDYLNSFVFDSSYFIEAQKYNPYYNKRLCIDQNGDIKNCLKNFNSFGNIDNCVMKDIVVSEEFQKLWYARHDLIEEIKDHELRYNMFLTNDLEPLENGLFRIIN